MVNIRFQPSDIRLGNGERGKQICLCEGGLQLLSIRGMWFNSIWFKKFSDFALDLFIRK